MASDNIGVFLTESQLIELLNVLEFRMNAKFGRTSADRPSVEQQAAWDELHGLLGDKLNRLHLING